MVALVGHAFLELAHERNVSTLRKALKAENLPHAGIGSENSATRLRNYLIVGMAANHIASALGRRCLIATARIRSGMKGNLLHPVATWPSQLNSYFFDTNTYENFDFNLAALNGGSGVSFDCGREDWSGRTYDLPNLQGGEKTFASRIDRFLAAVEVDPVKYGLSNAQLADLRKRGQCLILGGTRRGAKFTPPRRKLKEFYHFLALYLLPHERPANELAPTPHNESLVGIGLLVKQMFQALEVSENDDKRDFESEGLALVSDLIPALANTETAPSDAISYFLQRMGDILKKHTLGIDDRHTWVRFVAIDTVFEGTGAFTPRFHVFPHHDAVSSDQTAIGSFLISHPKRLATVKVIVKQWANANKISLSSEFSQLFGGLERVKAKYDTILKCVCVSEDDDKALWKRMNLDVTEDNKKTRCTLGFIVERQISGKQTPYAIIAFESDIPDAFSQRDGERFRGLIDACGDLLISLRLSSASFDLKQKIRDAFSETSTLPPIGNRPVGEETPFGKFRFELMRIDKDLLDKIIDSSEKRIWEGGGLTQEDARKFIADELKEMPGKRDRDAGDTLGEGPTSGIVFNSIMSARDKWVIENGARLHECWRDSLVAGDIYEFLTNVPSNIVWHCYLNAIPRALAERTGSVNELREVVGSYAHAGTLGQGVGSNPIFQVMQHGGLSALAMFVFSTGTQEFRQIIKLSDYQKIKDEAENYRNYVRYNVPLSARLPTSGKTYEGDGNTEGAVDRIGKIPRSLRSFGALVSDLIAGSRDEERPITLLDRVIELTLSPISGEPAAGRDVIARNNEILEFESAIRYQFKNNTSRWRDWPGVNQWTSPHTNVTDKVRAITRVFLNGDDALLRLNRRLGTGPIEYDKLIKLCVEKLVGVPFRDVADRLQAISREGAEVRMIDARQLGSVIHGDLNARNLVWSKDYVKFFMIDFERVGMGFYGADQIRLVFSLLSDLVVDAYRKERFGATVRTHELEGRIDEVEKILEDVNSAIAHTALITKAVENWQPDEGQPVKLPPPPVGGVAARAVSVILDDDMFSKGNRAFWTFAIAMTAAKQFEYALRGIDDSCTETLKIVAAKVDVDGDRFNLYRYFEHDELKQRKHDKFVFGKIARVLLAYRALASTLIIGDSNVLPA